MREPLSPATALLFFAALAGACSDPGPGAGASPDLGTPPGQGDQAPPASPPGVPAIPQGLDVGLFWFGAGDQWERHEPGRRSAYYDPRRPTVIHLHGWRRGAAAGGTSKSFNYKRNEPGHGVDVNMADAWVRAGWNVGMLYWGQLADEDLVWDAEAKIWSDKGPRGLRYRMADGSYRDDLRGVSSVVELLLAYYLNGLWDYAGPGVRLTGHSLGNQLLLGLSDRVLSLARAGQVPAALVVKRGALLDPFWSNGAKDFLGGQWTGERARALAQRLAAEGMALEQHRTSAINDLLVGDNNLELQRTTAYAELRPDFIPAVALEARHTAAGQLYYYNFAFGPTKECAPAGDACQLTGKAGPGPQASDERIREIMAAGQRHVLVEGLMTLTPEDDVYRREAR